MPAVSIKYNPYHRPAGTPQGGEFASAESGGGPSYVGTGSFGDKRRKLSKAEAKKLLNSAIPEEFQHLRDKYGDPDVYTTDWNVSYYSHDEKALVLSEKHYDADADRRDRVLLHEWGHYIDYAYFRHVNYSSFGHRSSPAWNRVKKALDTDSAAVLKNIGTMELNDPAYVDKLISRTKPGIESRPFSDFVMALTNTKVGRGHSVEYYKDDPIMRHTEMFAQAMLMRGRAHSTEAYANHLAPHWYAQFEKIIAKPKKKSLKAITATGQPVFISIAPCKSYSLLEPERS